MANDHATSFTLQGKLQLAFEQLAYLPRALLLAWHAAKGWSVAWAVLLVIEGLLPAALVFLSKLLVNSLVAATGNGAAANVATRLQIERTFLLAAIMAGLLLLMELVKSAGAAIRSVQAELIQDHISGLIHEKSVSVDMSFYETPQYHDHLHRARDEAATRTSGLLENGGNLFQHLITLITLGALLVPYGWWLPVVLVAGALPALYVVVLHQLRYHRWWSQTTQIRRWTQYFDWILTDDDAAAELRLFGLGPHFQRSFQKLRARLRRRQLRLLKAQTLGQFGAGVLALLLSGAAMAWMAWRALNGKANLGDLALFYAAFTRGQEMTHSLLQNLGQTYVNLLFLSNLFTFLDLESQVVDPPEPLPAPEKMRQGIRFRDVTFRYPGSERVALEGFNLEIPAGQVVAIVGANGAGKSTLLKLLCRFYDPDAGVVEFDGTDIRQFAVADLRRLIAVLFQLPIPYHATAGQNIAMGDRDARPTRAQIEVAARGAGAHEVIEKLPRRYDTLLGKWFVDGTELSAGERQRVALARAFLRRSQVVVLDEPTSFMDSWAETEWLERFRTLVKDHTAVIITHRFTTALHADIIHVMGKGRIIESGTHEELLAQGGLYAQSWASQMKDSHVEDAMSQQHTRVDRDFKQTSLV